MKAPSRKHFRLWFPCAVLFAGLGLTILSTYFAWRSFELRNRAEFNESVQEALAKVDSRLEAYVALLRGGAGMIAASPEITAGRFRAYVDRLNLDENYPGIQGVGLTLRVPVEEKDAFEERLRADRMASFRIWPDHPRDEYHAIVYLEPMDRRNQAAIGYDMFSDPVRRAAMERARDTGRRALSGKVTLVQEIEPDKQPGFLLYVPVYHGGAVPESLEDRRERLIGFVYSPFRAGDLFRTLLEEEGEKGLDIEIYDQNQAGPDALLFRLDTDQRSGSWLRLSYSTVETMPVAGHHWTVRVVGQPRGRPGEWLAPMLLIAGTALSFILFRLTKTEGVALAAAEESSRQLRASEGALRQSEERWRLIIENAKDFAIFSTDPEGRVTSWNSGAERMFGYTEQEVIGRSFEVLFTAEDRAEGMPAQELKNAREAGFASDDRVHRRKDGTTLYVSGAVRPMFDPGSGAHLGFIKITRDVSDRVLAEQTVRSEKEFSETIVNSLPGVFYLFERTGKWLRWNDNAESVLGYSSEQMRRMHPLDMVAHEDRSRVAQEIQEVLAQGQSQAMASLLTRDGRRIPYLLSGRRIALNEVPCVMGLGVDISEQKRVEDELRRAEERLRDYTTELEHRVAERTDHLQQSIQSLEGVLYHVAHDLRAPLRSMASFTQLLLEEYGERLDAGGKNYARRIVASSRRMDELVQDLLAYGRLAHMPIPLTRVSLEAEIDVMLENFAREIRARGATVEVQRPLPAVKANSGVLNEVLSQLFSNALKFVPSTTHPAIRIFAEDGGSVRVIIQDNGIGIQRVYHDRIFRIFERLHVAEEFTGTGIGLALVQKGVERMGGRVGVESEPGKGSQFWVELPPG